MPRYSSAFTIGGLESKSKGIESQSPDKKDISPGIAKFSYIGTQGRHSKLIIGVADLKSRYIILLLLVSIFSVIVSVEIIDIFGFQTFRPIIEVGSSGNETVLSWQRLPYLVYYEIEVLSRFPSNDSVVSPAPTFRLMRFRTLQNQWIISQDFPFQTF